MRHFRHVLGFSPGQQLVNNGSYPILQSNGEDLISLGVDAFNALSLNICDSPEKEICIINSNKSSSQL